MPCLFSRKRNASDALRQADKQGKLNDALVTLVETGICLRAGFQARVQPIITGDGKAMLASNFEKGGTRDYFCLTCRVSSQTAGWLRERRLFVFLLSDELFS